MFLIGLPPECYTKSGLRTLKHCLIRKLLSFGAQSSPTILVLIFNRFSWPTSLTQVFAQSFSNLCTVYAITLLSCRLLTSFISPSLLGRALTCFLRHIKMRQCFKARQSLQPAFRFLASMLPRC